jgi:hypothetical protein
MNVLPDYAPVAFFQSSKPIPHHLGAGACPIEDDRDLLWPVSALVKL